MAHLTPEQQHLIQEVILGLGFNPSVDFQREDTATHYTLIHRETKQYFTVVGIPDESNTYLYRYSRYPSAAREYSKETGQPLDAVGTHLSTWLTDHVRTQIRNDNLGDHWRKTSVQLSSTQKFFGDEGIFPELDAIHLEKALSEFPNFVRTLKFMPEHVRFWMDEVEQLKKEIRVVKKKAFLYKLLGLALSIGQFIDDKEKRGDLIAWFDKEAEFVRYRLLKR